MACPDNGRGFGDPNCPTLFDALHASGVAPAQAAQGRTAIGTQLPLLTPAQDEALLYEAGFSQLQLFYTAFTFRSWVAYK